MKKHLFILIMILSIIWTANVYGKDKPNTANNKAVVYKIKGEVYFKTTGDWKVMEVGNSLDSGDEVFTGINSLVLIQLEDKTKILVDSLTHFKFSKLAIRRPGYDGSSDVSLSLSLGSLSANVVKSSGMSKSFGVSTPAGTASVRGTKKRVTYSPDEGMEVKVLSGVVDVVDSLNRSISVSGGTSTNLSANSSARTPTEVVSQSYTPRSAASSVVQEQARELAETFFDSSNLQFATDFFSDMDLQKL
jgi:hypothetical protein